jgi:hypothetical protein
MHKVPNFSTVCIKSIATSSRLGLEFNASEAFTLPLCYEAISRNKVINQIITFCRKYLLNLRQYFQRIL